MRQLTIVSGAGINLGIAAACPHADEMLNFTYQKISTSVYSRVEPAIRNMFSPESFDYILGGLLTVNLAIEKTKEDLKRFKMDEQAFSDLFRQSHLQQSIVDALGEIERQLTISLGQMLGVVDVFSPSIDHLFASYDSINYFTVNFDGIFDHIIYGKNYRRSGSVTDFWTANGRLNQGADQHLRIFHLHGDLRYKPSKKTLYNAPTYQWPVLVVGDQEVKKGVIASNEALRFYNNCLKQVCESRGDYRENNLAIIGFGFREEDEHIVNRIRHGIGTGIFDTISLFDPDDKLAPFTKGHTWTRAGSESLVNFIGRL
jgi:hypothetical protein